ncbi:MAG: gliding motility protein GldN [Sediminibacterium sp.]|nr:gliding motility protein GldN [Sediminibacterium sp.]
MKKNIIFIICLLFIFLKSYSQFNLGKKNNTSNKPIVDPKTKNTPIKKDTVRSIKNLTKPDPSNPPSTDIPTEEIKVLQPISEAEFLSDTSNELLDNNIPKSLRKNSAFETLELNPDEVSNDKTPLEYPKLREEDALYKVILWEEIDAREKMNQPFLYQGKEDGDQRFFALLVKAVIKEGITAFSAEGGDDNFTKPLSTQEIVTIIRGSIEKHIIQNVDNPNKYDTSNIINPELAVNPDSVYTYRLKVQYIFDRATSALYKRIIGIAPIAKFKIKNVVSNKTLFWFYYPDLRPYLSKYNVYNPKNLANAMSWEELFEARLFSSYIVKSSFDNYNDKYLNSIIKDPILRLLEAEKIKEAIYNFESDKWVY